MTMAYHPGQLCLFNGNPSERKRVEPNVLRNSPKPGNEKGYGEHDWKRLFVNGYKCALRRWEGRRRGWPGKTAP